MDYRSYEIKFKRDCVEITKNGNFLMSADNLEEAKKEINAIEEPSLEIQELVPA